MPEVCPKECFTLKNHFVVQTSEFLVINAAAVTLGQGHEKFIQYIFPDPFLICPKLCLLQTVLMWEAKVAAAAAVDADAKTNGKHNVSPDRGDLISCKEPNCQ